MTSKPSIEDVRALEQFIARDGSASLLLTLQGILRSHEEMRAALATLPADDVREALARTLWEAAVGDNPEGVPGESWEELLAEEPVWAQGYYFQADAVMRAFEVRPHGTVTDAEVEAGAWTLLDRGMDLADRSPSQEVYEEAKADARAVLEAAREVHP